MRYLSIVLAFCATVVGFSSARASTGDPIGSTLKVVDIVTAQLYRDTRSLKVGDRVRQDERIDVGTAGSSEIKLDDDTKLALGPGATLTLDKFVYDPDRTQGAIFLNLVKGAFRFITGKAAKPAYVIKVPVAAITVRGTIFDVYVQDNGTTWLLLHEGGVEVCNARGKCILDREPGKLIRISEDGEIGTPVRWKSLAGSDAVPFDTAFPFVATPPSVDPSPIFSREAIINGDASDLPAKQDKSELPRRSDATGIPQLKADKPPTQAHNTENSAGVGLPLAARTIPTRTRLVRDPENAGKMLKATSVLVPAILDRITSHRYAGDDEADRILERGGWAHLKPGSMHLGDRWTHLKAGLMPLGDRLLKSRYPRSRMAY